MTASDCDVAVIGAGPGGYVAALRAAQDGARVVLVEKEELGGTCLNRGCIPTKTMMRDAEVYRDVTSGQFAVCADAPIRVDFARLMARKEQVVHSLVEGIEHLLASRKVTVLRGTGRLLGGHQVAVTTTDGEQEFMAHAIVLASGSVPAQVPIPGVDLPGVLTSREFLAIDHLPESIVVIGASAVGVEFASMLHTLGSRVTVLGRRSFLRDAEPQLAKRFRALLARQGVDVQVGLEFQAIERLDDGRLRVHYDRRGAQSADGEVVLLATGREPVTEGLGLQAAGVQLAGRAIGVDAHLQTNVPGIYAIGDCIGGHMLAHVASYEAEVAIDNILGEPREADYRVVPNCIFTMPEIAGVGLTEEQAQEQGLNYAVARFPFMVNGRAAALGETEGQVRIIAEAEPHGKGRILGVHIMGPHASDLIAEAALAMQLEATPEDIARTIHAHPTVPEALMEAAMNCGRGAIHYEQR
ncbi:MAG: dihydrolipoyl dehydrogenase [Anaerolineales bacterium]